MYTWVYFWCYVGLNTTILKKLTEIFDSLSFSLSHFFVLYYLHFLITQWFAVQKPDSFEVEILFS